MAHAFSMKELALQAGVSLATVDRVLHERPHVNPATRRRVRQAWAELERQQQQIGLQGRRFLVDLVMEAPERFSLMVRDALGEVMRQLHPAVFRAREHLAETLPLPDLVGVLDAIGRRGSQGVLLKAPDLPEVAAAVARLQARGIPVITLVTDMRHAPRRAYVGLDNGGAGRTAAYLVRQWLGPVWATGQRVDVLVSTSGPHFQGEDERIEAFTQALAGRPGRCQAHVMDRGRGLHGPTMQAAGRLLASQPAVGAVYSVGGANAALLAAFERAGRACQVFIGHDLDADNLALLRAGRLSAVLHHDLRQDLHLACRLILQAHGAARADRLPVRSSLEVITPYNLPRASAGN